MCTVSWTRPSGEGYRLFFNRDEQRAREPADPPAASRLGDIDFLAPRDGRAGGTWLVANARGLSVGLLNHYAADAAAADLIQPTSRGQLVLSFADCRDLGDFDARCKTLEPHGEYRPFLLFALAPGDDARLWTWDGVAWRRSPTPDDRLLTTSSFETRSVESARRGRRAELGDDPTPGALRELHAGHDPERPAHSIRMRRADAQTVSRSEVEVGGGKVRFLYRPEPDAGLEELPATGIEIDQSV